MDTRKRIVEIALENGASLAGIARVEGLRSSPSHSIYTQMGDYSGVGTVRDGETLPVHRLFQWPDAARSALVIALSHPEDRPELDWWDGRGTPGNRRLMDIVKAIRPLIENELKVATRPLHYYVEKGGVFLKDAAVLAGLGCIGRNNMLVTPEYGPRVRLRALFLDTELDPTGPVAFDPCADCKVYCRRVCPEKAMDGKAPIFQSMDAPEDLPARDGSYDRELCNVRMEKDVARSRQGASGEQGPVKYCRKCEFVCPVGKKSKTKTVP